MTTAEKTLTADEFMSLPGPIEGGKVELVAGRVVAMAPVGELHARRSNHLGRRLEEFAELHELGIVGVELGFRLSRDPDTLLAPDVCFVASERLDPQRDPEKYIDGPPTLAIEVISPDDRNLDVQSKTGKYLAAGVDRVWIVRPRTRTVTVHRPGGDAHTYGPGDTLTSEDAGFTVDGFALALDDLFA